MWQVERILKELAKEERRPQVLIMENVPQVCNERNCDDWESWLQSLEAMGYTNYFRILNAKDYAIPQNRKRCFCVSVLGQFSYEFPKPMPLKNKLKDFLDESVSERYFLSERMLNCMNAIKGNYDRKKVFERSCKDGSDKSNTITCLEGCRPCSTFLKIPNNTKQGYSIAHEGDGVLPTWKNARGTVQKDSSPTLMTTNDHIGVVVKDGQDR